MANSQLPVLKRSSDFQKIKDSGKKIWPCRWLLLSYSPNQEESFRCGWTVPKKVGSAVVRNRLKRWCREFFRSKIQSDLSGEKPSFEMNADLNVVFIGLRKEGQDFFKKMKFAEFQKNMSKAWNKLEKENNCMTLSQRS